MANATGRGVKGALALVALVACGHAAPPIVPGPIAVPVRAPTAGDALLARVPAEADLLIEVDLARAMANPVIGGATTAWVAPTRGDARAIPTLPGLALGAAPAPLSGVRTLAIVAYGIGSGAPAAVTLLVTDREVPDGVALGDGVVALGPPALIARLQAVARGETPALSTDDEFLALRAQAMPRAATGATARLTARLDLDARVALGAVVGSDLAPASLSIWADVADDAAAVAIADGHDAADGGGPRLAAALGRARSALAGSTALLHLGLLPAVKAARITRQGDRVEVIATIGPRRLAEVASRIATAAAVDEPPPDANRK